jgi:formylglycine-generating enzyme required for sulfatase activity
MRGTRALSGSTQERLKGMRRIDGGAFVMGSERFYPEERPRRKVIVDTFWIDATPVTNRDFARFVAETGYVTTAETGPDPAQYPGLLPDMARPGSLVFTPTAGPVHLDDAAQWWRYCFGADWRRPLGPDAPACLEDHPVVHVTYADAEAYAAWAGKTLATEAEWEFAARGGLKSAEFAWGDELAPEGRMLANYWQGEFPWRNTLADGYERTSPVGAFAANGYGLHDMIGNVWEWTADWYAEAKAPASSCCAPRNPRGGAEEDSFDPSLADLRIGRKVLKGGSHLCAANYCARYRPAARIGHPTDTSTSHIGFRCVIRGA